VTHSYPFRRNPIKFHQLQSTEIILLDTPPKVLYKLYNTNNKGGVQKGGNYMTALEEFGRFFKEMRAHTGLTLRNFCQQNNLDAGNISKLERGLIAPPKSREKLDEYANYLKIEKGSDDWFRFYDLASACSGMIPPDILDDARLAAKLPLLFRTLRGQDVPDEKLPELAELIRRS
jgi:transcriptional regulator with XRE-family HTH domain